MFDKHKFATNKLAGLLRKSLFRAIIVHVVIFKTVDATKMIISTTLSRIVSERGSLRGLNDELLPLWSGMSLLVFRS